MKSARLYSTGTQVVKTAAGYPRTGGGVLGSCGWWRLLGGTPPALHSVEDAGRKLNHLVIVPAGVAVRCVAGVAWGRRQALSGFCWF